MIDIERSEHIKTLNEQFAVYVIVRHFYADGYSELVCYMRYKGTNNQIPIRRGPFNDTQVLKSILNKIQRTEYNFLKESGNGQC